jgi:hypothetical protein
MRQSTSIAGAAAFLGLLVSVCSPSILQPSVLQQEAPSGHVKKLFTQFAELHGKFYADERVRQSRLAIFSANLAYIRKHNANSTHTFRLGIGPFADQTSEEFQRLFRPLQIANRTAGHQQPVGQQLLGTQQLPSSVDWQQKHAVTAVKNQGHCGGCWAFATTGALEGAWAIAGNPLTSLSEQQLLDCATTDGNSGCKGGTPQAAVEYVIKNGGISPGR